MHCDLHVGNVLNNLGILGDCFITDLGLSKPADYKKEEGKIYGVLPYVAPEVLRGGEYTPAADIYSFSIIAAEMFTGFPPYYDMGHDESLALRICQGLRPQFKIKVPELLEDLIRKCWDDDPKSRPDSIELMRVLPNLYNEIIEGIIGVNSNFVKQIKKAEEFNQDLPNA
jgi:serine/threonine protein kinase